MKVALVLLLFVSSLGIDNLSQFKGRRDIASLTEESVEIFLDEALNLMSERAIQIIEQSAQLSLNMGQSEIQHFVKQSLRKVRYQLLNPVKAALVRYSDAVVFTTLFRLLKSLVIYPLLVYNGLPHLIPAVGMTVFSSDLWVGVYIIIRNKIVNLVDGIRLGHSVHKLEQLRDELLNARQSRELTFHNIAVDDQFYSIDVRQNSLASSLRRIVGRVDDEAISVARLEELVGDKRFIENAIEFKSKPYLYNEILISKILQSEEKAIQLLGDLGKNSDDNFTSSFLRLINGYVDRVTTSFAGFDDSFNRLMKQDLSVKMPNLHPEVVSFKISLWRYRRSIKSQISTLRFMEYQLLADYLEHNGVVKSDYYREGLTSAQKYIDKKLMMMGMVEKEFQNIVTLDDLNRVFDKIKEREGTCLFLLRLLAI